MATFKLLLFPGDGIGPEVMAELEKIIDRFNKEGVAKFEIEKGLVGGCAYDAHGKAISDSDMGSPKRPTRSFWPPSAVRSGTASLMTFGPRQGFCVCARSSAFTPT